MTDEQIAELKAAPVGREAAAALAEVCISKNTLFAIAAAASLPASSAWKCETGSKGRCVCYVGVTVWPLAGEGMAAQLPCW